METDLVIICPKCKQEAKFSFMASVMINKNHLTYFENNKSFTVDKKQNSSGSYRYYATHLKWLHQPLANSTGLPDEYSFDHWVHKYHINPSRHFTNSGTLFCPSCVLINQHNLNWPDEAFFKVNYKNEVLWAYDRSTALKLLDYIKSSTREKALNKIQRSEKNAYIVQDPFLRKVPEIFQTKKARPHIVKELEKILGLAN